jgi:hypothetical protein
MVRGGGRRRNHLRCPEMLTRQIGNPSLSASGIWLPGDYEITCQT